MSDPPHSANASEGFGRTVAEGSASLQDLQKTAASAADGIDQAFEKAGLSLAKSLSRAASDGKVSLAELASAALSAFEAFAKTPGSGGADKSLVSALSDTFSSLFGARADGGPVTSGGTYLVGERGPELFRPSTAGDVSPLGAGGATVVNVTIQGGGAAAILRSEAQIAGALARAVRMGSR